MIEFLSSSIKSLGVAIIIVSILEMLLPNNKIKKYIRMVMGIFILFNIIAPFIQNKDKFDLNEILRKCLRSGICLYQFIYHRNCKFYRCKSSIDEPENRKIIYARNGKRYNQKS